MEPIRIQMAHEFEGVTYALHPLSRRRILARWPDLRVVPVVFVGYERRDQFEELHRPILPQIVALLTGHSVRELMDAFGGVELYEPGAPASARNLEAA